MIRSVGNPGWIPVVRDRHWKAGTKLQALLDIPSSFVVLRARPSECRTIVNDPTPKRHHSDEQTLSQGSKLVIDARWDLAMVPTSDKSIAFQLTQRARQHPLRNPFATPLALNRASQTKRSIAYDQSAAADRAFRRSANIIQLACRCANILSSRLK